MSDLPVPKVVEKLEQARTLLRDAGLDLASYIPSIVVIGDQSTGKSSLLSALTGLQLPTGNDTVTRAPLKIFIRPGIERRAKLRYRLRTFDGSHVDRELDAQPETLGQMIRDVQENMKKHLHDANARADCRIQWQDHVLGDLNGNHWLLKDEIELFVDLPDAPGSFTVVDLPGLHRPTGEDAFTQELQRFVTEKIKYDNVIILDVMTADLATAAGKSNLSLGHNLAFGVDRQCSRTLTVLTKADRLGKTPDKISDALTAAVVRSKGKHGCVMVATHPDGFQTEEECMKLFEDAVEFSKLKELGGGLGKAHLFSQLVQLQEEMLEGMPRFIVQLEDKLCELDQKLESYKFQPVSEQAAEQLLDERLRAVERSFRDACKNAELLGNETTTAMLSAVHNAANSYVEKQSSFIPGILGKKKVLGIILKAAHQDEKVNHPEILSEYTASKLFQEFHGEVAKDGVEFVMDVHKAIQEHIICLLKRYLEDLPDLSPVVVDAANHLLKEYQAPLCAAVTDLTHAYTYVVEPLHVQVLYMTYQRLLIIASGILVNQFDIEQAQGLHHDAKDKKATPVQQILDPANSTDLDTQLDQAGKSIAGKLLANKNGENGSTSKLVGDAIKTVASVALAPFVGPFADALGGGIGVLATSAWELSRKMLLKYKAEYKTKKNGPKISGYKPAEYQDDLVPLAWPSGADPMTSFELMCKMMNCDPSYVVEALDFYYKKFREAIISDQKGRRYGPVELQRQFIACLCRMLCSHYAMTESVAKLVRMRLMSTVSSAPYTSAAPIQEPLPNVLAVNLLKRVKAARKGRLLKLVVGEKQDKAMKDLQKQRQAVQDTLEHLRPTCALAC